MIRTRIAPSPTGYLHVGNLRSGLYSYLFAKKHEGKFLVRIEDTDRERLVADAISVMLQSLYWTNIIPDQGVKLDLGQETIIQEGDKGPYIQSERLAVYAEYIKTLLKNGSAYYCFCTSERLSALREEQQSNKQPTKYDRHCLGLSTTEINALLVAKQPHVIRLKMPDTDETVFNDLIRGEVRFKNELIDDQVLIKSDGYPTYHFAVVVDDHCMEITHVIRGEEWISSTPKHIELYRAFGWTAPKFAHLPLLLNSDRSKLSKRQGDVAVLDYKKKGYLPEALINFVAFLGWNPGDEREIFSLEELIKEFSLEKVNKSGAVFNLEKLDWYNKQYLLKMDLDELSKRVKLFLNEKYTNVAPTKLEQAIDLERGRSTTLLELAHKIEYLLTEDDLSYPVEFLVWKKSSKDEVKKVLPEIFSFLQTFDANQWTKLGLTEKVVEWVKNNGYTNGMVLWPLRVALSGQENSPGPFEIAEVLGKEITLQRIRTAISLVE